MIPDLPYPGYVWANYIHCWCFSEKPTHIITLDEWSDFAGKDGRGGIVQRQCAGIYIHCFDKDDAINEARQALAKKKYGYCYGYPSMGGEIGFLYTVHFPRYESEENGYINLHCVNKVRPHRNLEIIYKDK